MNGAPASGICRERRKSHESKSPRRVGEGKAEANSREDPPISDPSVFAEASLSHRTKREFEQGNRGTRQYQSLRRRGSRDERER